MAERLSNPAPSFTFDSIERAIEDVRAGRFVVHGSHDRDRVRRGRFAIEIDAGQAFGTAHHASTRGCLLALDELAKRGRPDLVLDLRDTPAPSNQHGHETKSDTHLCVHSSGTGASCRRVHQPR